MVVCKIDTGNLLKRVWRTGCTSGTGIIIVKSFVADSYIFALLNQIRQNIHVLIYGIQGKSDTIEGTFNYYLIANTTAY